MVILKKKTGDVVVSSSFPKKKFLISANAIAFEVLSSKLYTDIHRAIVRELSTNAYDSHVDAGCPQKPFDVRLPNAFEPTFSIRDYGTGLTPEQVDFVVTNYFESLRRGSNDFIGGLGLGSKTPFAYTDQFIFISFLNGVKYTFTAFKDEDGEPSCILASEEDTTEPNGVEVTFNVISQDDFREFRRAAEEVYPYFKVRPNITGAPVELREFKPEFSNENYMAKAKSYDFSVVMGNVKYDVDPDKVVNPFQSDDIGIILFMPIGSCTFAVSREELQYDAMTIENVNAALQVAYEDVEAKVKDILSIEKTALGRAVLGWKYKEFCEVKTIYFPIDEKNAYSCQRYTTRKNKLYQYKDYSAKISAEFTPVFVEDDLTNEWKQGDKSRLRQWIDLNVPQGSDATRVYVVKIEDRAIFTERFGEPAITMSALPVVERKAKDDTIKPATLRTFVKVMTHTANYYRSRMVECWSNIKDLSTIDPAKCVAVIREGAYVHFNGSHSTPHAVYTYSHEILGEDILILGIARKHYDRIRKQLGLEDLETLLKKRVAEEFAKLNEFDFYLLKNGSQYADTKLLSAIRGLSPVCDKYVKVCNHTLKLDDSIQRLIRTWHTVPSTVDYAKEFKNRYPLLASVNTSVASKADIIEYVELIERKP